MLTFTIDDVGQKAKMMKLGDMGSVVRDWQHIIKVKEDGIFGPLTEQATKEWQRERGFEDTGSVSKHMINCHNGEITASFLDSILSPNWLIP